MPEPFAPLCCEPGIKWALHGSEKHRLILILHSRNHCAEVFVSSDGALNRLCYYFVANGRPLKTRSATLYKSGLSFLHVIQVFCRLYLQTKLDHLL